MRNVTLLCFSLFFSFCISAQYKNSFTISWSASINSSKNENKLQLPIFDSIFFSGTKPFYLRNYYSNIELSSILEFSNIDLRPVSDEDLKYLMFYSILPSEKIEYNFHKVNNNGFSSYCLKLFPFIKVNNSFYRIYRADFVSLKLDNSLKRRDEKSFVAKSVLSQGTGDWYKLRILDEGFYKIGYSDLINYGIDLSILKPKDIHLFGNATGKLPELNNIKRPDDLLENAIEIIGGDDGSFDLNDYILFYATGASRLYQQDTIYKRDLNIYSDFAYFFLRIDPNHPPKRTTFSDYSAQSSSSIINSFDYYDVHEIEDTSLVFGGQRWYGEMFDLNLNYNFKFVFPTKNCTFARLDFSYATNSRTSGSIFNIKNANSFLYSEPVPYIGSEYIRKEGNFTHFLNSNIANYSLELIRSVPSVILFLDKLEINASCSLSYEGKTFNFRDGKHVQSTSYVTYQLDKLPESITVFDVTDRQNIKRVVGKYTKDGFAFTYPTDILYEFAMLSNSDLKIPSLVSKIGHQNIHGLDYTDLLIVSPDEFIDEAKRLAEIHELEGTKTEVVSLEQVYNEFSSGSPDPTAIKWVAKMLYDKNKLDSVKQLKNLLLFGDGTFDPKNRIVNNNYKVPTYQFLASEDFLSAMVSDDYYGILDDTESIEDGDLLDIGVGRLLISNNEQAKSQVDKIEQYLKKGLAIDTIDCCGEVKQSSFGDWRTKIVQITDDEENGYFINQDAEPQSKYILNTKPAINVVKLYSDAFKQVVQAGGERYPELVSAISDNVNQGSLILNYIGHGGPVGAAEERFITIPQIDSWSNFSKLPLFVTSTCEFTKYDDPTHISAGERMALNPKGGAIALMTTTRPVYFSVNSETGKNFFNSALNTDELGRSYTLGEIIRRTKNKSAASSNKRSFTLIGDPALRLPIPSNKLIVDSINGISVLNKLDTLRALSVNRISGHLENYKGELLHQDGVIYPTVFDKNRIKRTLGQDPTSPIITYSDQQNKLFKGRSEIKSGLFSFNFIIPKDIDYKYDNGKISLYSNQGNTDALGYSNQFVVGGINSKMLRDSIGPEMLMYLNDSHFVNGGLVNSDPILIVELKDESGVNIVGNGIGHDLTAIIDGQVSNPINLNSNYIADLNSYQKGKIIYKLKQLSNGNHSLKLKVWDNNNNSTEKEISFIVKKDNNTEIDHVYNYPNPFTDHTRFYFERNQVCNEQNVRIEIFTISGRLVKTIQQHINQTGFRSDGIFWDGRDDYGDKLSKGVYVYKLSLKNMDGSFTQKTEKLVLF